MNGSRQAFELFKSALPLDAPQRQAFLDRECADDVSLRREVIALLAADADAGDFLAEPLPQRLDRSGEMLGPYRLVRHVGSGGMGSVYRAERIDGVFSRPVAIKLLLYDAGDLRQRFALEQRILGALDHPNIARLLDVGGDATGAPYLVMEFVEGQAITQYVQEQDLALSARLELFLKILDAVQVAHSALVVHRDIKPGNVLVDGHGEPKLLDFGIAKLIGEQAPAATRTGLGPLTPDYASPEQVRGEPVGIGTDIYSLGVLLYELITDQQPYRISDRRPSEIERIVCDTDPPRPSTHLPTQRIAGSRRDLDAIVLKALEKSPRRRYASCAAFADDLRRWLAGEQVQAREPAWSERSQRFLRRHRFGVSVAAATTLALLIGTAFALWQARVARSERDRAERINRFLTDMLSAASPADLGRKATVNDVLDRAQRLAERELIDDPRTGAGTELTLAQTYHALGDLDAAQRSAEAALAAALRSGDAADTVGAQVELGEILTQRGNVDAAEPVLRAAHDGSSALSDRRLSAAAATALGSLQNQRGNAAQAQIWFETALLELPADAAGARAEAMNDLAIARNAQGDSAAALALQQQVVDLLQHTYPHGHPDLAKGLANLGSALEIAGRFDDAAAAYARALPMQIDLLGENHPDVVETLASMTNLDLRRDDTAAALRDGERAWSAAQHLAAAHPMNAYAASMYAQALCAAGRGRDAVPLVEQALAARRSGLPPDHPLIASTESVLGLARAQAGDTASGQRLAREAYERLRAKLGEEHELTIHAKQRLAQIEALPTAAKAP
jgi:eukaryotic-like serine/threonine-protein kinase